MRTPAPRLRAGRLAHAFARTWFKLTQWRHGLARAALGPREVPAEELIWQDPIPRVDHPLIDEHDMTAPKAKVCLRARECLRRSPRS